MWKEDDTYSRLYLSDLMTSWIAALERVMATISSKTDRRKRQSFRADFATCFFSYVKETKKGRDLGTDLFSPLLEKMDMQELSHLAWGVYQLDIKDTAWRTSQRPSTCTTISVFVCINGGMWLPVLIHDSTVPMLKLHRPSLTHIHTLPRTAADPAESQGRTITIFSGQYLTHNFYGILTNNTPNEYYWGNNILLCEHCGRRWRGPLFLVHYKFPVCFFNTKFLFCFTIYQLNVNFLSLIEIMLNFKRWMWSCQNSDQLLYSVH